MSDEENAPPPPASPPPRKNGKPPAHEKRSWTNAGGEADLLWNEILEADATDEGMAQLGLPGRGADGFGVHITRLTPNQTSLGGFPGAAVPATPGDLSSGGIALRQYVIDNFHKASGGGPAKYQVRFYIKAKGGTLTQGYLSLPSHSELAAMMPNPYGGMMGRAPPAPQGWPQPMMPQMPPWGWGPPPQQPQPAPAPPPASIAAAPPLAALPPGTDPSVVALIGSLQQQIGYLSGQLQQVIAKPEAPTSVPFQMPAVIGAPAPAPVATDAAEMRLLQKLVEWGVIQKPGTPLGAPPVVAAPPPAPGAAGQAAMGQLSEALNVLEQFATLGRTFRATGSRVAEAFKDPEEEEPPKPDEVPKPEDMLPWQRVQIGNDFTWALDKETGGPSAHGIIAEMMNKPEVRDRVMGLADKAIDLGREFMSRTKGPVPSSAAPQLVAGTPPQTPQGSNQGGGWGPGT